MSLRLLLLAALCISGCAADTSQSPAARNAEGWHALRVGAAFASREWLLAIAKASALDAFERMWSETSEVQAHVDLKNVTLNLRHSQ